MPSHRRRRPEQKAPRPRRQLEIRWVASSGRPKAPRPRRNRTDSTPLLRRLPRHDLQSLPEPLHACRRQLRRARTLPGRRMRPAVIKLCLLRRPAPECVSGWRRNFAAQSPAGQGSAGRTSHHLQFGSRTHHRIRIGSASPTGSGRLRGMPFWVFTLGRRMPQRRMPAAAAYGNTVEPKPATACPASDFPKEECGHDPARCTADACRKPGLAAGGSSAASGKANRARRTAGAELPVF